MSKTCPEPSWANIWERNLGVEERESKREGRRRVRRKGGRWRTRKEGRREGREGEEKKRFLMEQRAIKVSTVILMFQVRKQEPIVFK